MSYSINNITSSGNSRTIPESWDQIDIEEENTTSQISSTTQITARVTRTSLRKSTDIELDDSSQFGKVQETNFNPTQFLEQLSNQRQHRYNLRSSGGYSGGADETKTPLSHSGTIRESFFHMNLRSSGDAAKLSPSGSASTTARTSQVGSAQLMAAETRNNPLDLYQRYFLEHDSYPPRYLSYSTSHPQDPTKSGWFTHATHFLPLQILAELKNLEYFEDIYEGKTRFLIPCLVTANKEQTSKMDSRNKKELNRYKLSVIEFTVLDSGAPNHLFLRASSDYTVNTLSYYYNFEESDPRKKRFEKNISEIYNSKNTNEYNKKYSNVMRTYDSESGMQICIPEKR
jgi:hypothetical protein